MKKGLIFLFIISFILICGCFEKNVNINLNDNLKSNIKELKKTDNISKNQSYQNNILNNSIYKNNKTEIKSSLNKTLSYEIIAYGSFGDKNKGYYYYYKDNKTIIVINLGELPSAGYNIKIINITKVDNNKITVYYKVIPPKEYAAMVITAPYIKISVNGKYIVECEEIE